MCLACFTAASGAGVGAGPAVGSVTLKTTAFVGSGDDVRAFGMSKCSPARASRFSACRSPARRRLPSARPRAPAGNVETPSGGRQVFGAITRSDTDIKVVIRRQVGALIVVMLRRL
jgi:hypothetical protein